MAARLKKNTVAEQPPSCLALRAETPRFARLLSMRVAVEGRTLPARSARQDEAECTQNLFLTLRSARQRASPARFARQKGEAEALPPGSLRHASAYGLRHGDDEEKAS